MRVGGVELKVVDSVLSVVNPRPHPEEHNRHGRLRVRPHLGPEFLENGRRIGPGGGIVPLRATFNPQAVNGNRSRSFGKPGE